MMSYVELERRSMLEGLAGEFCGTLWLAAADGESARVTGKCCIDLRLLEDYIQSNETQELVIIKCWEECGAYCTRVAQ